MRCVRRGVAAFGIQACCLRYWDPTRSLQGSVFVTGGRADISGPWLLYANITSQPSSGGTKS